MAAKRNRNEAASGENEKRESPRSSPERKKPVYSEIDTQSREQLDKLLEDTSSTMRQFVEFSLWLLNRLQKEGLLPATLKPDREAKTEAVYFEADRGTNAILKNVSKKYDISISKLVSAAVGQIGRLHREDQLVDFLQTKRPTIKNLARAIELLQWSQHAFVNKRWYWCCSVNEALLTECKGIKEIERFASYRVGYCNLEIANEFIDMMPGAIVGRRGDGFASLGEIHRRCGEALKVCIYFSQKSKGIEAAQYNIACARALYSLANAIKSIKWDSQEKDCLDIVESMIGWVASKGSNPLDGSRVNAEFPWKKLLAEKWGAMSVKEECVDQGEVGSIEATLLKAVQALKDWVKSATASVIPVDTGELVRWAFVDPDLEMLRHNPSKDVAKMFDGWRKSLSGMSNPISSFDKQMEAMDKTDYADEIRATII